MCPALGSISIIQFSFIYSFVNVFKSLIQFFLSSKVLVNEPRPSFSKYLNLKYQISYLPPNFSFSLIPKRFKQSVLLFPNKNDCNDVLSPSQSQSRATKVHQPTKADRI